MKDKRIRLAVLAAVVSVTLIAGAAFAVKTYREAPSPQPLEYNASKGGPKANACPVSDRGGSCCSSGDAGERSALVEKTGRLAAEYYRDRYGGSDFTVQVRDFGCHMEAFVIKDGKTLKRLSISGGNINEIG
jgi:hypothetical protein